MFFKYSYTSQFHNAPCSASLKNIDLFLVLGLLLNMHVFIYAIVFKYIVETLKLKFHYRNKFSSEHFDSVANYNFAC